MEHCPYTTYTHSYLQPCPLDTNAFGPTHAPPPPLRSLPNHGYSGRCQPSDLHIRELASGSNRSRVQRLYDPFHAHAIPVDQYLPGYQSPGSRIPSQRSPTHPSCTKTGTQSLLPCVNSQNYGNQTVPPTRKYKRLPPPTLSPMLLSSIPTPAPRRPTLSTRSSSTSMSSLSRSWSSDDTWTSQSCHSNSGLDSDDDEKTTRTQVISDRPWAEPLADQKILSWQRAQLPTRDQQYVDDSSLESGEDLESCLSFSLTLSESIWGPGWRQVEPMPPSFVKTLEQTEIEAQAQALLLQQLAQTTNPKTKAKRAKQAAAAAAAANKDSLSEEIATSSITSSTTTSTTDSGVPPASHNSLNAARLPRSLQFVEEIN